MTTEAYKDHRPGSTKGKVHKVFDEKGKEAAVKAAEKAGIQTSTVRTWCSTWGADKPAKKKKTVKKAAAAKKTATKKASPKKAAPKKAVKRERITEAAAAA